ncbi:hypothetical protein QTP86_000675 [Hemibagrus guttatus]|nr:hypothetical protein QTP86_000675 [Hemibagrus guttatus]
MPQSKRQRQTEQKDILDAKFRRAEGDYVQNPRPDALPDTTLPFFWAWGRHCIQWLWFEALAGNRARAFRMIGEKSTTEPPMPLYEHCDKPAAVVPPHSEVVRMALPEKFDGREVDPLPRITSRTSLRRTMRRPPAHREGSQLGIHCVGSRFTGGRDVSVQLLELRQGSKLAAHYAVEFCTLAAQSGWNDPELVAVFHEGLWLALQVEMACQDINTSLSDYITTDIFLDNLMHQQRPGPRLRPEPWPRDEFWRLMKEGPEPMQLDRTGASQEE